MLKCVNICYGDFDVFEFSKFKLKKKKETFLSFTSEFIFADEDTWTGLT